jgi:bifunctional ADP-heptose synthase (sugar kinase/adenylyltransferase)
VVITDGARGAFVASSEEILFAPAIGSKVVGTAGAGDVFAATFTAYVALGHPIREALRAATINSASVVGHIDTKRACSTVRSSISVWRGLHNQPFVGGQYSARKSEKVLLGIKAHFGKLVILCT